MFVSKFFSFLFINFEQRLRVVLNTMSKAKKRLPLQTNSTFTLVFSI